jgi:hypothetical protein
MSAKLKSAKRKVRKDSSTLHFALYASRFAIYPYSFASGSENLAIEETSVSLGTPQ